MTKQAPVKPIFPKLTEEQCNLVTSWLAERMRPLDDVLAELERPEALAYLDSIGAPRLDDQIKNWARGSTLRVGGSNGGTSFKETSTFMDIDVFFMIPTGSSPTDSQIGMLRSLLNRRLTDEMLEQRTRCTIEGVAMEINGWRRYLDFPKVGILYKGVIWASPARCRHCNRWFNDGRFVAPEGRITHEDCLGA